MFAVIMVCAIPFYVAYCIYCVIRHYFPKETRHSYEYIHKYVIAYDLRRKCPLKTTYKNWDSVMGTYIDERLVKYYPEFRNVTELRRYLTTVKKIDPVQIHCKQMR